MTPEELTARRKALGLKQAEMVELLDMSLRGYSKLESGEAPIRGIYELAVDRIGLRLAVSNGRIEMAPAGVRNDALELARLITGL